MDYNLDPRTLIHQGDGLDVLPVMKSPGDLLGLVLSFNRLRRLPFLPPFRALQRLDLSHNCLEELGPLSQSCPALQHLNVSHNSLHDLRCVGGVGGLTEVVAHANRFRDAPVLAAHLRTLPSLQLAVLHDNPFLEVSTAVVGALRMGGGLSREVGMGVGGVGQGGGAVDTRGVAPLTHIFIHACPSLTRLCVASDELSGAPALLDIDASLTAQALAWVEGGERPRYLREYDRAMGKGVGASSSSGGGGAFNNKGVGGGSPVKSPKRLVNGGWETPPPPPWMSTTAAAAATSSNSSALHSTNHTSTTTSSSGGSFAVAAATTTSGNAAPLRSTGVPTRFVKPLPRVQAEVNRARSTGPMGIKGTGSSSSSSSSNNVSPPSGTGSPGSLNLSFITPRSTSTSILIPPLHQQQQQQQHQQQQQQFQAGQVMFSAPPPPASIPLPRQLPPRSLPPFQGVSTVGGFPPPPFSSPMPPPASPRPGGSTWVPPPPQRLMAGNGFPATAPPLIQAPSSTSSSSSSSGGGGGGDGLSGDQALASASEARQRMSAMLAALQGTLPDLGDRAHRAGFVPHRDAALYQQQQQQQQQQGEYDGGVMGSGRRAAAVLKGGGGGVKGGSGMKEDVDVARLLKTARGSPLKLLAGSESGSGSGGSGGDEEEEEEGKEEEILNYDHGNVSTMEFGQYGGGKGGGDSGGEAARDAILLQGGGGGGGNVGSPPSQLPPPPPTRSTAGVSLVKYARYYSLGADGTLRPWAQDDTNRLHSLGQGVPMMGDGGSITIKWPSGGIAIQVARDSGALAGIKKLGLGELVTTAVSLCAYVREGTGGGGNLAIMWSAQGSGSVTASHSGATLLTVGEDGSGYHGDGVGGGRVKRGGDAGKMMLRRWGPGGALIWTDPAFKNTVTPLSPDRALYAPPPPHSSSSVSNTTGSGTAGTYSSHGRDSSGDWGEGGVLEHEEEEEEEQEQQVPLNPSMAAAMAATQAAQAAAVAMMKARALINSHTVKGPGMEASIPSDPAQAKIEDEMCLVSAARDILDLPRVGRPPKGVAVDKALFSPTGVGFVLGSHLAAVLLFAGNSGPNAPTTFRGVGGKPNLMRRHRLVVLFSCRGVRYGIEMEQQEI